MTVVRPFRALRYDADRLDLSRVIVPPYDVIEADDFIVVARRGTGAMDALSEGRVENLVDQ